MTRGVSRFWGYAALFDRADRAGDVFRRGAFSGAPAEVPLLAQHRGPPVGRVRVAEDERGLRVTGEAAVAVAVGQGLSIGYRPISVVAAVRGRARRELLAVDLVEVSLVAQPMQPLARVTRLDVPRAAEPAEDSAAPGGGSAEPIPSDGGAP